MSTIIEAQDAQNILVLLDRVEVKGLNEVQVTAVVSQKLRNIVREAAIDASVEEVLESGEDTPSTD